MVILRSRISKKCYGRRRKLALDSSMMKKTATASNTKGKKLDANATCVVDSCQGKDVRVNMLWHWMWNYSQSCQDKHSSLHVYCRSPS